MSSSLISNNNIQPTPIYRSFNELPYELYLEILEYISGPILDLVPFYTRTKDVAAISLVCKATRRPGQVSLHRHICFTTVVSMHRWLKSETHYAVRSIRFGEFDTKKERQWMGIERGELMMKIIGKCPGVKRLILFGCDGWDADIGYYPILDLERLRFTGGYFLLLRHSTNNSKLMRNYFTR